jgi:hypothetical protein
VETIERLEIEEATTHDVEIARLGQQLVGDVDLVDLAITDANGCGDVATSDVAAYAAC